MNTTKTDIENQRVTQAAQVLGMTKEELDTKLTAMGLEYGDLNDDTVFKFCDLREAFMDKPIATVRKAFRALRSSGPLQVALPGSQRAAELRDIGYKVKLDDADTATLIRHYMPNKPSDPVSTVLKKRFQDKLVIAFRDDGTVAVDETVAYLSDLEQGFPPQGTLEVDGTLTRLWPVGVVPDTMLDEDPLFPGKPLRGHRSIVNQRNWSKVTHETKQLCRIILDRDEVNVDDREAVLRLIERAEKGVDELKSVYPEAHLEFRERQKRDELPKLKITLGDNVQRQNPFGVNLNRKY